MGLDRPTSGTVTVNGKPYRQHRAPLREVGALLEASAVHPGPQRPLTPAHHGRHPQHQGLPGQRGHRDDRPGRGSDQARRRVLPRHGPAPGHRRGPPRRPQDAHPRRAGQRSRPPRACSGSASSCAPWPPKDDRLPLLTLLGQLAVRGQSPLRRFREPASKRSWSQSWSRSARYAAVHPHPRKVLPSPPAGRGQPRTRDRGPCKRQVVGSIPTGGSIIISTNARSERPPRSCWRCCAGRGPAGGGDLPAGVPHQAAVVAARRGRRSA